MAMCSPVTFNPQPFTSPIIPTVLELISEYERHWNIHFRQYNPFPPNEALLQQLLTLNNRYFRCPLDLEECYGFLEKKDLPPRSTIFVRADLHGDLKSIIENLKTLQRDNYLDENFRCRSKVYLIFLGDYMDRGFFSLQVLTLLLALRLENRDQVILIRGNHEDLRLNFQASIDFNDEFLSNFIINQINYNLLSTFYKTTLPLSFFASERGAIRQYVQFTHGAFELYVDPSKLLESENSTDYMKIPLNRKISSLWAEKMRSDDYCLAEKLLKRSHNTLMRRSLKRAIAAQHIKLLWSKENRRGDINHYTIFNWGDISFDQRSQIDDYTQRRWKISALDLKHFLTLCSPIHKIKMIFRGHSHQFNHHIFHDKIITTTLPLGSDCTPYFTVYPNLKDITYLLKIANRVRDWTKKIYIRYKSETTITVLGPFNINNALF